STRSHELPSVPARISAPQTVSPIRASRRRRKYQAMSGIAASDTKGQIRDGKRPQATPGLVASWIQKTPGTIFVTVPGENAAKAQALVATSRQAPASASAAK